MRKQNNGLNKVYINDPIIFTVLWGSVSNNKAIRIMYQLRQQVDWGELRKPKHTCNMLSVAGWGCRR